MAPISLDTVLKEIGKNFLTVLIVDESGNIRAVERLDTWPTSSHAKQVGARHKGCAFRYFERQALSKEQLQLEIGGLVETIKLGRTGKFKPGANLINKQDHVEWAQDAARRQLKKNRGQV